MKVLVAENIANEGIDYLKENEFEVDCKFGLSRSELLNIISDYDAIIIRSVTQIDKELIDNAVKLKVVGRAGTGIDNIDTEYCTKKGIIAVNTPGSNTMSAAELAIGMAFCIFRNIPESYLKGKLNKDFRRSLFVGREIDGKTLGIIGLGRIGSIVAKKMKGCNMKVIAYDPYIADDKFEKLNVEKCENLDELLEKSDLISIHTPRTEETIDIIGKEEIDKCKDGVYIVNAARGGLVNEDALYNALKNKKVAGAALDVLDPEPGYDLEPEKQTYENKLFELDNFLATPHLGASTKEAKYNVGTNVAKYVVEALQGGIVPAVNVPNLGSGDVTSLKPFIELAETLGRIYYQTEKDTVQKIEVVYSGELAKKETKIITLAAMKGFLAPVVKEKVNYVNAEFVLNEMGIELIEAKSSSIERYSNLITIKFTTKKKELCLSGTVFAKEEIRIVDFFGYKLNFEPSKYVLALQNVDKPGIIGKVGTLLGELGINIASMQWSRNRKGEKAVSFVSIDGEIDKITLDKIKQIDGILKASQIKL